MTHNTSWNDNRTSVELLRHHHTLLSLKMELTSSTPDSDEALRLVHWLIDHTDYMLEGVNGA